jgi:Carboxypeptidase regulatory-like domain
VRSYRRALWLVLFLALNASVFAQAPKKDTQLRSVRGVVADRDEKPIPNAVVFLKNLRTTTVISHFSDDEGDYRFTGLDTNVDYEVFAQFNGQKSATRTVSALDSRREITLNLKVDRKND